MFFLMTVLALIGAGCVMAGGYAYVDRKLDSFLEGRAERKLLEGMRKVEQEERAQRLLEAANEEIRKAEIELEEEMKSW